MSSDELSLFLLNEWEVLPSECLVRVVAGASNGELQKISPRAMDVLVYLAHRPEEVVSTEELLDELWNGSIVAPNAVQKCVNELRRVFGDNARDPKIIKTVPKRGYKLMIRPQESSPDAVPTEPDLNLLAASNKRKKRQLVAAAAFSALFLFSVLFIGWPDGGDSVEPSIVILPFTNVDGHKENDYLAFGITEALLVGLAKVPGLQVASRADAASTQSSNLSPQSIAQSIEAKHLLTGSVQRNGERIRVSVKLTQFPEGRLLYSEQFDQDTTDLMNIQDKIAMQVVELLSVALDVNHRKRMVDWGTSSPAAYLAYLQGEYLFHHETDTENWSKALELYEEAIANDPKFSKAYAMMIGVLNATSLRVDTASLGKVRAHAASVYTTALENDIDSTITAEMSLTMRMLNGVGLAGVERQCRQQFYSGQATAMTYTTYGRLLMGAKLFREGMAYVNIAQSFADDDHRFAYEQIKNPGRKGLGRIDQSIAVLKRARLTNPNNIPNLGGLILMSLQIGDVRQAEFYLDELARSDSSGIWHYSLSMIFDAATAKQMLDDMANETSLRKGVDFNYGNGAAYLILGDVERGLTYWEQLSSQAIEVLYYWLPGIEVLFPDSVVSDSRYQQFLSELGIGIPWTKHLLAKVEELSEITGIALTEQTKADLEARWSHLEITELDGAVVEAL